MAVKTSTRKRVNGRKRVSKQDNRIKVDRAISTLKVKTSSSIKSFINSYQAVSLTMFSLSILICLSFFNMGGPIGTVLNKLLQWAFGYAYFAFPAYLLYGSICLLYTSPSPRDRTRSRMPSSA